MWLIIFSFSNQSYYYLINLINFMYTLWEGMNGIIQGVTYFFGFTILKIFSWEMIEIEMIRN